MKRRFQATTVVLVLILAVAFVPGVLTRPGALCDGAVPVWYPSDDGCSEIPALVEHLWPPARWGAPVFCQGMCMDLPTPRKRDVRADWIASHPDAVAH